MRFFLSLAAALMVLSVPSTGTPLYNIHIIQPSGTAGFVSAWAFNNAGQVGGSTAAGLFIGSPGSYTSIPAPGAFNAVISAINDAGAAIVTPLGGEFVRLWSESTGYSTLLPPPGFAFSGATAMNNTGLVGGYSFVGGVQTGVVWTNGVPQAVAGTSDVFGINDAGQIVGRMQDPTIGFVGTAGGTITPVSVPGRNVTLFGINNSGMMVGSCPLSGSSIHALCFFNGSSVTVLPHLAGVDTMALYATQIMNNSGAITGVAYNRSDLANIRGWLWSAQGGLVDLTSVVDSGWTILRGYSVNDSGQILAEGQFGGASYAVRLDPISQAANIPEPALWVPVGLCMIGLLSREAFRYQKPR